MNCTFLGTGTSQGVPVIGCDCEVCSSDDARDKRLRCSVLIQWEGKAIVIDCGPDFRQQMLREGVDWIDAILLTHEHNDHMIGLDDVRPLNFKYRRDMIVYATTRVQDSLKERFGYIFATQNRYPGAPMIKLKTIDHLASFEVEDIAIQPVLVMHGSMPVLGFRIKDFAYLTDVKTIPEEELPKLTGLKTLIINALHHNHHYTHLNLSEALEMISILKPEQAYLTHISHRMGKHAEVTKLLPPNVHLAFDGLQIEIV